MRNQPQTTPPPEYRDQSQRNDEYGQRVEYFLQMTSALRGQIETSRRLTPDQEATLNDLADRLQIEPPLEPNYLIFRELWAAENDEQVYLSTIDAPHPHLSQERCCFAEPAVWRQPDASSSRYPRTRFSTPFPLTKHAGYRISSPKPRYRGSEGTREMASGRLHITAVKVFFDSAALSTSITFNGLTNVECYSNGLEVGKSNGRSEFFQMTTLASEYAYMIIQEISRIR